MKATIFLISLFLSAISVLGQLNHRKSQVGQNHFDIKGNKTTSEIQNGVREFQKRGIEKSLNKQSNQILKSSSVVKQSLDSIVYDVLDEVSGEYIFDGKEVFTYDSKGNLISEIYRNWDESIVKDEYAYDSNGNVTLEINYKWDETTSNFIVTSKSENTYDSKNNLTLKVENIWDGTNNTWIESKKSECGYDLNEKLTLEIQYRWDETISNWIVDIKIENGYDSNGKLILHIDYNSTADKVTRKGEYKYDSSGNLTLGINSLWNETTSKWVVRDKIEYTYDLKGNLTLDFIYNWEETTSNWVEHNKDEYTYDSNGNKALVINYIWYTTNSKWIELNKNEYAYDSNGNITVNIYFEWDATSNNWGNVYKNENTYNSNSTQTSGSSYEWDKTTSKWVGSFKWEDGYDLYGNTTFISEYSWNQSTSNCKGDFKEELIFDYTYFANDLIVPNWYIEEYKHKITDALSYSINENSGEWYIDGRSKLFYSDKTISRIDGSKQKEFKLYPNPTSDKLNVTTTDLNGEIAIYDTFGNRLVHLKISNNHMEIDVSKFSQGTYLVHVISNNQVCTSKFVKF